jgi:hypothetical protein
MTEIWPCRADEVRDVLAPAFNPKANPGGLHTVDLICAAGQCFKIEQGGKIVGAYVVQAFGPDLWITAAAGAAENDLCKVMAAALQHQGEQFDSLVFKTNRPGLMKKALALGYECTMRRKLK